MLAFIVSWLIVFPCELLLAWFFCRGLIRVIKSTVVHTKTEMKKGKSLWQALNNNNGEIGGYTAPKHDHGTSFDYNTGYTSSRLASDPMFSCLPGNINHRR